MGKKIEYSNDELTIIWQPEVCQPCPGICVKMLPQVYRPKERPCSGSKTLRQTG